MSGELPTAAPGVRVPKHHRGGTYLRRQLGVGAHKGDRHAARLLKSHAIAFLGEFAGTTLFTLFAFAGTTVASLPATSVTSSGATADAGAVQPSPNTSSLLYVALAFGFSLAVNIQIFAGVSGGVFNPAISLGLALIGAHTPIRALILTVAQMIGSIAGAAITSALLPGPLNVRTTLVAGTSIARGLFIEMFLTALLMLTVLVVTVEKSSIGAEAGSIAPVSIGLALFLAELCGVFYTGGSLSVQQSQSYSGEESSGFTSSWDLGTPEASKMLLEGPKQEDAGANTGLKNEESKESGHSNTPVQGDLRHSMSRQSQNDARSILSVVSAAVPEPQDRMAQLESSNQRIEAMLRSLTAGAGHPGSPVTTVAASIATKHRKMSGEDSVHGEDQLYMTPSQI
ncbi:hypothetical protein C6P46_005367 [Rhodotorula mucilaginosa]|uniref:Aquaporin-like protein n=1 Tax=Rhodotorula mucilaginosa TaxID=5537 RepID=A0A9P6VYY4_RHOMI|nr:hypothetical protein C6P46_005367 [Rhodotorula mucilaginosa]TKA57997.1 hypothetical protein B0A53_00399 [Rhodotorula sp. CCFEE 5036]